VIASKYSDVLRCMLSLFGLGNYITQAERLARRQRHLLHGPARVQWKLEQLSDCEGHLLRAFNELVTFDLQRHGDGGTYIHDVPERLRCFDNQCPHLENYTVVRSDAAEPPLEID